MGPAALWQEREDGLASRAQAGDRAAFDELVSATAKRVYATVYRLVGSVEEARDLTQETFLRVFRNLGTWKPERRFAPWLYRIATNVALDHLRSRRGETVSFLVESDSLAGIEQFPEGEAGPEARLLAGEAQVEVAAALRQLPPHYRAVLVLRYFHDLTHQEICDALDLPLATVKIHLHRGRERLARALLETRKTEGRGPA